MSQNLKTVLFLSAALNILLVGGVCGYLAGNTRPERHPAPPHLPAFGQGFSEEKEKDFHRMMEQVRQETEPLNDRIEQAREEVFAALTAKDFNPGAYLQKTQALHQLHGERASALSKAVQHMAQSLSQQEREILAQHLRRGPGAERPPPPPDHPPPGDRPPHGGPGGPPPEGGF